MSAPDIVCMGEALVEFNEREPGVFVQGFGGDTSNCAVAAARQGARAGYVTAVGADIFGDRLLALWRAEGVDASRVMRSDAHPTGHYFVTHERQGHAFTYHREGSAASRMRAADVPVDYVAGAKLLHVSAISEAISASAREAVRAAMDAARAGGARVSYDTNLRLALWPLEQARDAIHASAARADILLPGLEDARALTGLEAAEDIVRHYRALGPQVVALTLGAGGVLLADGDRLERIPGHAVDAMDATGAGDAFDGAFLALLAEGAEAREAARYANAAAALSTTGLGAVAPIPTREQVRALLDGGRAP